MTTGKVLLTGITGFLGSHTAIQLLNKGYHVTGTLRDRKRADSIRRMLSQHTSFINNLSFAEAELEDALVWKRLMDGVDYVQHIASPFPKTMPKDENDLIGPAVAGNKNILSAAASANVKRVVITGSSSAIQYGKLPSERSRTFSEEDWTDETRTGDLAPYYKSKTIAEKAAWEFIKTNNSGLELTVVCPGLILGPLLEEDFSASANVIIKIMDGSMPAVPKIGFDLVDVRSVASLLILAMEKPEAANQRYIGSPGFLHFRDISAILKKAFPTRKIPSRQLPNWLVRIFSNFETTLKPVLIDLGTERKLNRSKAVTQLGWQPIEAEEAVLSCANSLLQLGIVK